MSLPFHRRHFPQPRHVPLAAVEARAEVRADEVGRELGAHDLGAEAEHIHVVVLDALVGGVHVVADGRADPFELARGHRGADARAADEDPAVGEAVRERVADLLRLVGIVDADARIVRPQVDRVVPQLVEDLEDPLPELRSPMVERDRHLHVDAPPVATLHRSRFRPVAKGEPPVMEDFERWRELGQQLRADAVRASAAAGSGHPTSSMSAADLAAVLLAGHFRYDFESPKSPTNDRLIFSKGHASPLVYGLFRAAGAIPEEEFMTYRQFGSRLEGHQTPVLPWVDVATGSLGQGLPIGVGLALAGKRLDRLPFRTWVICGDSELAEGSMWEAADAAGFEQLEHLTAIVDVNRLGQRGETRWGWKLDVYAARFQAFGWHTIEIDGHDVEQIHAAYEEAERTSGRPTAVIARTLKGRGYSKLEDKGGYHGKAIGGDEAEEALRELGGVRNDVVEVPSPEGEPNAFDAPGGEWPRYEVGSKVATRKAYGEALAGLGGDDPRVVALDGEVDNSTYSEFFGKAFPERYFEMYIAEQQMVGAAVGMQIVGWKPFAATFAAFLSRAYDFVRMAAISQATIKLCGSHAGVSIGEDGPSQMALEDMASLRAINTSTVLYPSDGNQTAALVRAMADLEGISYLRTTRADTEVLYGPDDEF